MAVGKLASQSSRDEAKERLLVQAAQKDPVRFGELYESHFERIYAFIAHRVHDRAIAEDLTSDVFHKALASLPRYDWRGVPFAAWLYRIAANVVSDQWKRGAREIVEDPPDSGAEVDYEVIEHRAQLFRLVEQLPGTAARHHHAFHRGKKHSRHRRGDGTHGRSSKAIAIPGSGKIAEPDGWRA